MHGKIYNNITELIGRTPLVRLNRIVPAGAAEVVAKLESFNPLSSVKDRIAISMVSEAEKAGEIKPGVSTIVEATSGNTGIGLAFVAAAKGYKCTLVMPDTMSVERRKLLQALGAELILTPGPKGIKEAQRVAEEYAAKTKGAWLSKQFDNPANLKVHRETTAQEILRDTDGNVDAIVAGVGTGGTVTGVGQIFKKEKPNTLIVAVEPVESQVLKGGTHNPHKLQGIGAGMIPSIYDANVVDRVVDATWDDAAGDGAPAVEGRRNLRRHLFRSNRLGGDRDRQRAGRRQTGGRRPSRHGRALPLDRALRVHRSGQSAGHDSTNACGC